MDILGYGFSRDVKGHWSLDNSFAIHLPPLSVLSPVEGKNENTSQTSSARTGMANAFELIYQWYSVAGSCVSRAVRLGSHLRALCLISDVCYGLDLISMWSYGQIIINLKPEFAYQLPSRKAVICRLALLWLNKRSKGCLWLDQEESFASSF